MLAHHAHGLIERLGRAVVEVRRRLLNIPQRGNLEHHAISGVFGQALAAGIGLIRPRFDGADALIRRATQELAGVANHATDVREHLQALELFVVQSVFVAAEVFVPARRRHQLAFEGANRNTDVVVGDGLGRVGKGLAEQLAVAGNRLEPGNDRVGAGHGHFLRVQDRALGLLLDIGGASVPELRKVPGRVVNGR